MKKELPIQLSEIYILHFGKLLFGNKWKIDREIDEVYEEITECQLKFDTWSFNYFRVLTFQWNNLIGIDLSRCAISLKYKYDFGLYNFIDLVVTCIFKKMEFFLSHF